MGIVQAVPSPAAVTTPPLKKPLLATYSTALSWDILMTARVPVVPNTPSAVGAFTNHLHGQVEALVVTKPANGKQQLAHVARAPQTDGGWRLVPLFEDHAPSEVAAGTAYPNFPSATVYGFFQDEKALHFTSLGQDGATWASPAALRQGTHERLRVAYSPAGRLVLYGSSAGDLVLAYQPEVGAPFTVNICSMNGGLAAGEFHLSMTDEQTWQVAAVDGSGKPVLYLGELDAKQPSATQHVTDFQGTVKQIALGYWSKPNNTQMFLLVDDSNALHIWSGNASGETRGIQAIANSKVTTAAGHVATDGTLHVYTVDDKQGLWVLHQDPKKPWNHDDTPRWSPNISLDNGVAGLAHVGTPTESPSLFALDAADNTLRLHVKDRQTSMWSSGQVLHEGALGFEMARYRIEVTLMDAYGVPAANYPVTVSLSEGSSMADLSVGRNVVPLTSDKPASLTTNALGKLTLTILANAGLAAPNLVLNADGLAAPLTMMPAGPVHEYLSGNGALNPTRPGGPLPIFDADGNALSSAQTRDGQPLAPALGQNGGLAAPAAQAIRNTALVGLNKPPPNVAGYALDLTRRDEPRLHVYETDAQLQAALFPIAPLAAEDLSSLWGDIERWAGDIWEGIKNGVIKIAHFVVDVGKKIATFAVQVGDMFAQGVKLAIHGLEQAAHFVAGVFQALEADVEKVIDWLKALFDFQAIWHTKMAFEKALTAAPGFISGVLAQAQGKTDGWFTQQKALVDRYFTELKQHYAQQKFGGLNGWQPPGAPSSDTPVAGHATPADFSNNVHHNWLHDKVSATVPDSSPVGSDKLDSPWSDFAAKVQDCGVDFMKAVDDFKDAIVVLIKDPASFGTIGVADLLGTLDDLIDMMLDLSNAVVDGFLALAQTVMTVLEDLLTTPLDLGPINTLWEWLATSAGYPGDGKLTVAAFVSLLAAFPTTIFYKLVMGVAEEPFPNGDLPTQPGSVRSMAALATAGWPKGCVIAGAIVQGISVFPAIASLWLEEAAPWWLTLISLGFAIIAWVLQNGWPPLTGLEWALSGAGAANLLWIGPVIYFVIMSNTTVAQRKKAGQIGGDIANVLLTGYGLYMLITALVKDFTAPKTTTPLATAYGILTPLSSLFSVMGLSAARKSPAAPVLFGVQATGAIAGYVGGGIVLLLETV